MMKSARFLTSPSVQDTLPPNWAAISVGPCQSEVWLSITPPISSASADRLALGLAGDVAQAVDERHVGGVQELGRGLDRLVDRGLLAVDQGVGVEPLGGVVLEPRLAEDAGRLGLDDPLAVGVQLDVVADAPAERAGRVLRPRSVPSLRLRIRRELASAIGWAVRTGGGTTKLTPAPGRGNCRGCAAA